MDLIEQIKQLPLSLGPDKKRTIGEAAKEIGVKDYVIRFWEEKFPQITPVIGEGKRRYYYNKQVAILSYIKILLKDNGYTIKGLQKQLKNSKKDFNNFIKTIDQETTSEKISLESDIKATEFDTKATPKVKTISANTEQLSSYKEIEVAIDEDNEIYKSYKNNLEKIKNSLTKFQKDNTLPEAEEKATIAISTESKNNKEQIKKTEEINLLIKTIRGKINIFRHFVKNQS